jgi:hypothetical protein
MPIDRNVLLQIKLSSSVQVLKILIGPNAQANLVTTDAYDQHGRTLECNPAVVDPSLSAVQMTAIETIVGNDCALISSQPNGVSSNQFHSHTYSMR